MKPEEAISLFKWAEQQVGNAEHIELAISALEKQIPKKPIYDTTAIDEPYLMCECGTKINGFEKRPNYCPECGQALDWSVVEE